MFFRIFGAAVRALIVAMIIIIPSAIVSSGASQAQMFTFTFAIMVSAVVFVEYLVEVPAVLEFRLATPYIRLRVLLTASMALFLSHGLINQFLSGSMGVMSIIAIFIENLMINWPSPAKLICEAFGLSEVLVFDIVMRLAAFSSMMGFFSH